MLESILIAGPSPFPTMGSRVRMGVGLCCRGAGHGSGVSMGSILGMGASGGGKVGGEGVGVRASRQCRMESSLPFKSLRTWENAL